MSFLDLETLAMHRRSEMDVRICVMMTKCDEAQANIKKLEMQAQKLVQQLNCQPSQLKERFLNSMKLLDEYIYLVTDFNLSVEKIAETARNPDAVPVHDTSCKQQILTPTKAHLLDVLSERLPSTSSTCVTRPMPKPFPKKQKTKRITLEQPLIEFSSTSCSLESVSYNNRAQNTDKAGQIELPINDMCNLTLQEPSVQMHYNLPDQKVLQDDNIYEGGIIHVDGDTLYITEKLEQAANLVEEMYDYYKANLVLLSPERLMALRYCAYYDHKTDAWYRCFMLVPTVREDKDPIEVFLVDTGETRHVSLENIQPLVRQFCVEPPLARLCHLAGVDLVSNCSQDLLERRDAFLKQFIGDRCAFKINDNRSESLEVYVLLSTGEFLNELLVKEGLACLEEPNRPAGESVAGPPAPPYIPPQVGRSHDDWAGENLDSIDCPEHEDLLEAVTGYHNRDEMDICKNYKGGPNKTCFKGDRCTKKHILKHPDGWTRDRVEATSNCTTLPLPAPATWHRVLVTHVCHFDYVFVHYVTQTQEEQRRAFGDVLPPTTLAGLIQDMNSPAGRAAMLPLKLEPAPGEMVAALYPPDGQWYRAMVISHTIHDQSVEVHYVDFGGDVWVKENNVRQLQPAHTLLPFQAVKCRLAGVAARSDDIDQWVKAKARLQQLTTEQNLQMHVVSRNYDELEVELYNGEGSVAEILANEKLISLKKFDVLDEPECAHRIVVP